MLLDELPYSVLTGIPVTRQVFFHDTPRPGMLRSQLLPAYAELVADAFPLAPDAFGDVVCGNAGLHDPMLTSCRQRT